MALTFVKALLLFDLLPLELGDLSPHVFRQDVSTQAVPHHFLREWYTALRKVSK